jgi:hypothetical protein
MPSPLNKSHADARTKNRLTWHKGLSIDFQLEICLGSYSRGGANS